MVYDGGEISFTSRATLKWQGEISLMYPKKNFSLQFTNAHGAGRKIKLRDAWGKQSKYCLKANWNDYAGARNLVSAKLWGEIIHSRHKNDRLNPLVNGGAVDGYPVVLYMNGIFHGLYTLNMPKNRWVFDISKQDRRAGLLFAGNWTNSTSLRAQIDPEAPPEVSGWEVEYCATEDTAEGTGWLFAGMNALISFLLNSDDATFKAEIGDYTDVDRVIDYMLFVFFICGGDNLGRNIIWVTYDGKQYLPSAYDLDQTWKYKRSSTPEMTAAWYESDVILRTNLLFSRLLENFEEKIRDRYAALREELLEYGHIEELFSNHFGIVPDLVRAAESERWPSQKLPNGDPCADIMQFFTERAAALDKIYGSQTE